MRLKDLLEGVKFKTNAPISNSEEVTNVATNSKEVNSRGLFVALTGFKFDGHDFIDEAISRGASAVVSEKDFVVDEPVRKIIVPDSRIAISRISGNLYNHPSRALKVIGITGTNGKTTITYLAESILKAAKFSVGVIGTISYRIDDKVMDSLNTTPGPVESQAILTEMVDEGVRYAVMEVSSHSLDQHRVDAIDFDAALFTNISREHLDYHKRMENYLKAKMRLFRMLKKGGVAILNIDDKRVRSLKRSIKKRIVTYGLENKADVSARGVGLSIDGTRFTVSTPKGSFDVKTSLIGRHNISNILGACAIGLAEGIDLRHIKKGVEILRCVPGRLEQVNAGQDFSVFVDYAHTEDALYNVLSLLKEALKGKDCNVITVFGCGGDRDRSKRPKMGEVACRFSDKAIITSDNPRSEDPNSIIDDISKGIKGRCSNYDIIVDRAGAIKKALSLARNGDIVLIAGKGHEKYQIIGDRKVPFDDCEVVRSALRQRDSSPDR